MLAPDKILNGNSYVSAVLDRRKLPFRGEMIVLANGKSFRHDISAVSNSFFPIFEDSIESQFIETARVC